MSRRLLLTAVLLILSLLSAACGPVPASSGDAEESSASGTRERSSTAHQEPTVKRSERQVLTGIITDRGMGLLQNPKKPGGWILVEEDPDAECTGDRGPSKPGCGKMYFNITAETTVYLQEGSARKEVASVEDLNKGTRVSADYTGYDIAMSYPSQTGARTVAILRSP